MCTLIPLRQKREIKQKKEQTDRDKQIPYYTKNNLGLYYYPKKLTY